MGKISNASFMGKSDEQYRFEVYSWDTVFKQGLGGIYVYAKRYKLDDGSFTLDPVYIGEKADLSLLMGIHPKQKCIQDNSANCKCIYQIPDEERRLWVLQDLLASYEPLCNDPSDYKS